MYKIVIVRHGESVWNKENIFTGWTDVELSDLGRQQAKEAGQTLKENFSFDLAFASVLKRAEETLDIILKEMGVIIPIEKSWRLNERHYGALQGMNKNDIKNKYGEKKFLEWRRSYDIQPPALEKTDERYPGNDPLYADLKENELPLTESLKDTEARVMPYWRGKIVPEIMANKKILISAHGNSIRALIKNIENLSGEEIAKVEIPLGKPLVYELDESLKPITKNWL
ncbi:MAG: 2,3-diphosphoglycerate-dependent phosphoglycerate mutase [Candidatus Pacebacteria bacterium]|nr:2,3-diphosphoglycerate-dependent phosphoglycerate mutase [Candidatus Paceibacterota bacterium]